MSVVSEVDAIETKTRPLLATDRCDKCGAAAMRVARMHSKPQVELHFCDHHSNQHKDALFDQGFYFDIETIDGR
jgi:hypothetical protein